MVGANLLEDARVRRLRQTLTHYRGLLIAEASVEMVAVYRAEIAAAEAMLRELSGGTPHPG